MTPLSSCFEWADGRTLAEMCPRLSRAHRDERDRRRVGFAHRRFLRERVSRAERLVAHRDLQLVRASATRSGAYIAERERKLNAAHNQLAYYTAQLARAERAV